MERKRLTQVFPWLLPLRRRQRKLFFYAGMALDGVPYARSRSDAPLPFCLFESACPMYNPSTPFPMVYQENKVHNLRLAAAALHGVLIRPGETFSFWDRVRGADRAVPYRDALTEINGVLTPEYGGGLCQISNLLYWLFLHTPLTVTERHGHREKDFPEPPSDALPGTDATVAEGWLDLRVRNDTDQTFQIALAFDGDSIRGSVLVRDEPKERYRVLVRERRFRRTPDGITEEVTLARQTILPDGRISGETIVSRSRCRIGYPLPESTPIEPEERTGS